MKNQSRKPYWEMNAQELAEATKAFDDPNFEPKAVKSTPQQRAQLKRWQRKRTGARARLTLSLEKQLIEEADNYAVNHGITFSEVVTDALRQLMQKKSA